MRVEKLEDICEIKPYKCFRNNKFDTISLWTLENQVDTLSIEVLSRIIELIKDSVLYNTLVIKHKNNIIITDSAYNWDTCEVISTASQTDQLCKEVLNYIRSPYNTTPPKIAKRYTRMLKNISNFCHLTPFRMFIPFQPHNRIGLIYVPTLKEDCINTITAPELKRLVESIEALYKKYSDQGEGSVYLSGYLLAGKYVISSSFVRDINTGYILTHRFNRIDNTDMYTEVLNYLNPSALKEEIFKILKKKDGV